MKVFISQPMHGKTYEQVFAERNKIKDKIRNDFGNEVEFVESLAANFGENHLFSLAKQILALSEADCAVFCGEWYMSRGCAIEHLCCAYYDIPILKTYRG